MIKRLRRKLILITMVVITCVVTAIVGGINIVNFVNTNNEIDKVINVIVDNKGLMPKPEQGEPGGMGEQMPKDFERNNLSEETPFRTRYFTVEVIDSNVNINTSNVYMVSNDSALSFVDRVKSKNKTSGYIDKYKYKVTNNGDGTLYIFIDSEQEIMLLNNTLLTSSLIGLGAILLIFVLILIFSKIAVKPIAESYDKQRRFITDANHEIKTPLTIINATNEIMELKYGENEWTKTIDGQVKRLTELTEKLVILSKMEESNPTFKMDNVALSSTIKECANEFTILAEKEHKEYIVDVTSNIEGKADLNLIKRLVGILLDNAFKYTSEGDKIELQFSLAGKYKKLTVKNTVSSIPKGDLNYLFERFYRLDSSRNSETGGSGIGLSVAKAIANLHNGKITAKSDDGKSIQIDFIF